MKIANKVLETCLPWSKSCWGWVNNQGWINYQLFSQIQQIKDPNLLVRTLSKVIRNVSILSFASNNHKHQPKTKLSKKQELHTYIFVVRIGGRVFGAFGFILLLWNGCFLFGFHWFLWEFQMKPVGVGFLSRRKLFLWFFFFFIVFLLDKASLTGWVSFIC